MKFIFVVLLLLMNAFFVAAEFSLVRVRVSQLEGLRNDGNRSAALVLKMLEKIDSYLSAVQLGVTMASLGLGWLVEPAINKYFVMFLDWLSIGVPEAVTHSVSAVVAFTLASFLHIVIGEITPKSIAIAKPMDVAMFVARPMYIFDTIFAPVMYLLVASSNGLLRLLHITPVSGEHSAGVTADELRIIAQHSSSDGMITKEQGTLLNNVFNFTELNAREIMIPRSSVVAMSCNSTLEQFLVDALKTGHSRYPIFDENLDDIIGIVHIKDVIAAIHAVKPGNRNSAEYSAITADGGFTLRTLARKTVNIPETASINSVLETLQSKRSHMAVVVDEYGGTSGILTIEDAIERLVGNIEDEFDPEPEQNIVPLDDVPNGWRVSGSTLLSEFCEKLGLDDIECESDTVAGFIMEKLGKVASCGDTIDFSGYRLQVEIMDKLRIDKIVVKPVEPSEYESNPGSDLD